MLGWLWKMLDMANIYLILVQKREILMLRTVLIAVGLVWLPVVFGTSVSVIISVKSASTKLKLLLSMSKSR
jgi:hypothetical protein